MAERPVKVNIKPMDPEMLAWMWVKREQALASVAEIATQQVYRRRPWYRRWFR